MRLGKANFFIFIEKSELIVEKYDFILNFAPRIRKGINSSVFYTFPGACTMER